MKKIIIACALLVVVPAYAAPDPAIMALSQMLSEAQQREAKALEIAYQQKALYDQAQEKIAALQKELDAVRASAKPSP